MTPPVLPGEVWRGDVDGPVCVTVTDGAAEAWWWEPASEDGWLPTDCADIWKAWALSLRASLATVTTDRDHLADGAEPEAGPYDDRCRIGYGSEHRCVLRWDHGTRGVPCRVKVSPSTPEDMGAIMTACRNRGAEDMREVCAAVLAHAAKVRDAGEEHGRLTHNTLLAEVSKAEARALRHAEHQVRALPIPAPTSPPLCSCPDRIAAGTPYPDHRGRWGMDTHVARAWAEARDYDVTQDSEGNDYPMWCEVRGCPWCARPLPDGKAESLHVPGCARVETEGAGHPGACREPVAANDRGKP